MPSTSREPSIQSSYSATATLSVAGSKIKAGAELAMVELLAGETRVGVEGAMLSGTVAVTALEPDWGLTTARVGEAKAKKQTAASKNLGRRDID